MNSEIIVEHFHARPVGAGRWMAKCPAHLDRLASLSIREAGDKVLIHCFGGCETSSIVAAAGLSLRDLFSGPPPSAAQARATIAERQKRHEQEQEQRIADRAVRDKIGTLEAMADELASRLMRTPENDPAGDSMARLFHSTIEKLRAAEAEVSK